MHIAFQGALLLVSSLLANEALKLFVEVSLGG